MANDTEAAGRRRHDRSRAVRGLWLSKEQASLYQAEWKPIRGFPDDADHCSGCTSGRISCSGAVSIVSKTLAMHACFCGSAIIATVKIPKTDVREACCTFLVPQRALQEQNFAACEFEIQFT